MANKLMVQEQQGIRNLTFLGWGIRLGKHVWRDALKGETMAGWHYTKMRLFAVAVLLDKNASDCWRAITGVSPANESLLCVMDWEYPR